MNEPPLRCVEFNGDYPLSTLRVEGAPVSIGDSLQALTAQFGDPDGRMIFRNVLAAFTAAHAPGVWTNWIVEESNGDRYPVAYGARLPPGVRVVKAPERR